MIKRRLLILADHLDRVKPEKTGRQFNLNIWFVARGPACGTACCAVGEAAHIPELRRLGLGLTRGAFARTPAFKDACSWTAVERFFRLNEADAMHLFSSSYYADSVTPKDVAARIRAFVEHGGQRMTQ